MPIDPAHAERLSAVAQQLGLRVSAIEPLSGGSRNHVYRVSTAERAVVVRLAGADDERFGVQRASERLALQAAAAQGLAPQLLHWDEGAGVLVMDYVAGHAWTRTEAAGPRGIERIAAWLRQLHAVPVPAGLRQVDFLPTLADYAARLPPGHLARSLLVEAAAWQAQLGSIKAPVLCHHDLHHANILDTGERLLVVDWEYAGLGHPMMDLAAFAAYQALDRAAMQALLAAYGAGDPASLDRLVAGRRLFEAVWLAWDALSVLCDAIKKQS